MKDENASAEKPQDEHPPQKRFCFVIGPIGVRGTPERKRSDMLLRYIIHPALAEKYNVKRADEDARPGLITHHIIQDIYTADMIVADLSRLNPNAFYELGVAHALTKKIVHVCDVDTELPFDIKDYRAVFFDPTDPDSHEHASRQLAAHATALDRAKEISNPVTSAIGRKEAIDKISVTESVLSKLFQDVDNLKSIVGMIQRQDSWQHVRESKDKEQRLINDLIFEEIQRHFPGIRDIYVDHGKNEVRLRFDKRSSANRNEVLNGINAMLNSVGYAAHFDDKTSD